MSLSFHVVGTSGVSSSNPSGRYRNCCGPSVFAHTIIFATPSVRFVVVLYPKSCFAFSLVQYASTTSCGLIGKYFGLRLPGMFRLGKKCDKTMSASSLIVWSSAGPILIIWPTTLSENPHSTKYELKSSLYVNARF